LKGLHFLSPIFVDFWSEIIYVNFIVDAHNERKMLKDTLTLPPSRGREGWGAKEMEGSDGEGRTEERDLLGWGD
jgi:hypothetical protein